MSSDLDRVDAALLRLSEDLPAAPVDRALGPACGIARLPWLPSRAHVVSILEWRCYAITIDSNPQWFIYDSISASVLQSRSNVAPDQNRARPPSVGRAPVGERGREHDVPEDDEIWAFVHAKAKNVSTAKAAAEGAGDI